MQITPGKLVVTIIAGTLAFAGIGAATEGWRKADTGPPVQLAGDVDARKHDADDDVGVSTDDDDGDGDDTDGNDATNDALGSTGAGASSPSRVSVEGRTAAEWMATARLYKQRWLQTKLANDRHAQQVRNLRASASQQDSSSPSPRVARGGGGSSNSGGGGSFSGGGDT